MRPLTGSGRAQAETIAERLAEAGVHRLLSSPALRCRQTLAPLALATGLPIEIDDRLDEGCDETKTVELLALLRSRVAVVCSHGDQVGAMLERVRSEGAELDEEPLCEKGSIWTVERGRGGGRARYQPPDPGNGDDADGDPGTVRLAVLDLGSTSFHLLVADASPDGSIERVLNERVMLRLGSVIGEGGRVPEEVCARAVETARQLGETARRAQVDLLLPVATAALRDARNGREVARRIGEAVGVPTRIISGLEEARLTFAAFRRRLDVGSHLALGIDLGGGSLELITGDDRDVRFETTLPLGTARLHAELVRSDPMTRDERRAVRTRVRERLAEYAEAMKRWAPDPCVATGGSLRALARLAAAEEGRDPEASIHGRRIEAEALHELTRRLARSSQEERLEMPGMRRRRADLVPTGAVILDTLVEEFSLPALTVSDWGLREGVILEAIKGG
jgi:exopolyphosphatase/guanosine-5'-triphosphate,3'-diphosphate pyrophosphatase